MPSPLTTSPRQKRINQIVEARELGRLAALHGEQLLIPYAEDSHAHQVCLNAYWDELLRMEREQVHVSAGLEQGVPLRQIEDSLDAEEQQPVGWWSWFMSLLGARKE